MNLKKRLIFVQNKIRLAQKRSIFNNSVEIIGVTKNHSFETIVDAQKVGINSIGENRVQEAEHKFQSFKKTPKLIKRFIGHLQSNKVKKCVKLFDTIDSVHSFKLLKKISKESIKLNKTTPVLLEVNTSKEPQKHGFDTTNLEEILMCFDVHNVCVEGLMTIAPHTKDISLVRDSFVCLRELRDQISKTLKTNTLKELSMGMSGDYEIAIEEGSTQVRLGTILFGERK